MSSLPGWARRPHKTKDNELLNSEHISKMRLFEEACYLMESAWDTPEKRAKALAKHEARSEDSIRLWRRLVSEARERGYVPAT